MNNRNPIEQSLCRAIDQAPGLDFQQLAAIPVVKMTEHDYITRQTPVKLPREIKMPRYYRQISAAVAGCMVILACITTWFVQFKTPDSIIALDANQSVEIVTNKHKQILSVKAYNYEAQQFLDSQSFDANNLEASVNALVTAMISSGYLDEDRNVIMVSVENQSQDKADDLAVSLDQVIKDSASSQNLTPTVLRQSLTADKDAVALAEQYQVSTGKMKIIQEMTTADQSLVIDELAMMTVAELLDVSKDKNIDLSGIIQSDQTTPTNVKNNDSSTVPAPPDSSQTSSDPADPAVPLDSSKDSPAVTPPVTSEPLATDPKAGDDNTVVTPPEGSQTVTPPDSSVVIPPPDAEQNENNLEPQPTPEQTPLDPVPPADPETPVIPTETPVPITQN